MINNIPSIIFGHAWYQGCEGTHNIREIKKNLKNFIKSKKFKDIDNKKVELFFNKANRIAMPFYYKDIQKEYYPQHKKLSKITLLKNIKKLMILGLKLSKKISVNRNLVHIYHKD